MIVVNTKAYREGIGAEALKLAKIMEKVEEETGVEMVIAVQHADIFNVAENVGIKVFAQHIDTIKYGSHTGWILAEAVKEAGASGTILNHSEHMLKIEDIFEGIERAKEVGLETIVCAGDAIVAKAVACFEPDYVAIEPPELIGGDVSVTKAKPEVVERAVNAVRSVGKAKVLCGAGIKGGEDVRKAVELGVHGVLVASGVVKARDREKILMEMAGAMTG